MTTTSFIRRYFARLPDPYAGGDLDNAQKIGTVIWVLLTALLVVLVPLNPPTDPLGTEGWIPAALLFTGLAVVVYLMGNRRLGGWGRLLAVSYATVLAIGLMQWLSGGQTAPYRGTLLLPILFVAATQPPRKIAPFLGAVLLVLAAPFLYDTWDLTRAEGVAATFVSWCALAIGANVLMMGIRAQRLSHVAEETEARREARIDSLTGMHNRRAYDEALSTEVARARRLELPLALAMVDVENFKEVNDRWSYAAGDRCLREVGRAICENVREPDLCFRWGGDEFALILTGTTADETGPIEERLSDEVMAACRRPDESPLQIRFAVAELHEGMTAEELTERAGLALTSAKLEAAEAQVRP
ncbi:MAG TPA: GGDEF domain-containing protein [Solirubrobacterales bacterium]|jgi:diguanylate cyclase (GGDEF)-like protein